MWVPTPWRATRLGAVLATTVGEFVVEAGVVGVDVEDAAAEGLHGELGGVGDRVAVGVGAERGGGLSEKLDRGVTEPFPQLIGCGEAEMAELVEQLDAHLTSRAVRHQQHPDRFHVAIRGLGHAVGPTAECRSSGLDRVDGVGLAVTTPGLTIGAINLDHLHPGAAQEAGQARPVGAGALDTDPGQRPERTQPGVQVGEPGGGRGERFDAQHATVGVQRGGDMNIEVGVHPTSDRARLYDDGHRHPFLVQLIKGWHARPGKETVTIGLRQQADRSPSGTGRAHVCAATRSTSISNTLDAPTSQTRAAVAADRSHPQRTGGGPPSSQHPYSLASRLWPRHKSCSHANGRFRRSILGRSVVSMWVGTEGM